MSDKTIQEMLNEIKALQLKVNLTAEQKLNDKMLECFKYWSEKFPKRYLKVVSGMGTYTYDNDSTLDLDDFVCYDRKEKYNYKSKFEDTFKLFIEFDELYYEMWDWANCFSDFTYNPITKTIEYNNEIIYT